MFLVSVTLGGSIQLGIVVLVIITTHTDSLDGAYLSCKTVQLDVRKRFLIV